jgi:hypothetical protein
MQNKVIVTVLVALLLGFGGYILVQAQGGPMMGQGQRTPQGQAGPGPGMWGQWGQMGPGAWGHMGPGGMWGPMGSGPWGHMGPGGWSHMGPGIGMMGGMIDSPEIMGTMMAIRGDIMSLMGQMMQKYGNAYGEMTPDQWREMQKDTLERMGDILAKHGAALKAKAKEVGK